MSAKLSELFDGLTLPQTCAEGRILKIIHDQQNKELLINLEMDELCPAAEILTAEKQLSRKYRFSRAFMNRSTLRITFTR